MYNVNLIVTQNCNASCSFCYEKKEDKVMSEETMFKVIDFFYDKFKDQGISFAFFGGEPTLYPDLVISGIRRIVQKSNEFQSNTEIGMFTNCFLFREELISELQKAQEEPYINKVGIQVSYEGEGNFLRDKGNLELRETIKKNIRLYRESNLLIYARSTYSPENLLSVENVVNTLKFIMSTGVLAYDVFPVIEVEWEEKHFKIFEEAYKQIKDIMVEYYTNNRPESFLFNSYMFTKEYSSSAIRCGAGKEYTSTDTDGKFYFCQKVHPFSSDSDPENEDYFLGDVYTGEHRQISVNNDDYDKCVDCEVRGCAVCIVTNKRMLGSYFKIPDTGYCTIRKIIWKNYQTFLDELRNTGKYFFPQGDKKEIFQSLRLINQYINEIITPQSREEDFNEYFYSDFNGMILTITAGIFRKMKKYMKIDDTFMLKLSTNDNLYNYNKIFYYLEMIMLAIYNELFKSDLKLIDDINYIIRLKNILELSAVIHESGFTFNEKQQLNVLT